MEKEHCQFCDSETEMAGSEDDSIYVKILFDLRSPISIQGGDEAGPLCEECYKALETLGYVDIYIYEGRNC